MARIVPFFAIFVFAAASVRAEDSKIEEIRTHAAKAKVHYDLGEYQQAAEEYILVYRLKPLPAVLYNIAQSYRQAAQYEKAKQFYKSYLRETKDPENRALIEKAIREIDELLAKEKKAKDGPPTGVARDSSALAPPPTQVTVQPPLAKPAEVRAANPPAPPPAEVRAANPPAPPSAAVQPPPSQQPTAQPAGAQPAVAKDAGKTSKEPAKPPGTQVAVATPVPAPAVSTSTTRAPAVEAGTPFYKTWWFWTAAGVVAVGAGTAVALSAGGGSASPPATRLGSTPVF